MSRKILGRDAEQRLVDIEVSGNTGPIGSGGGGGEHPDLSAHTDLGLAAQHSHDFAATGHTHQAAAHDHDGSYAPVHSSHVHSHTAAEVGASATGHAHDYADPAHTHPGGAHDHDATYSALAHTHSYADPAHTHDTTHNHDAAYSGTAHTHDTTHNHDATYAPVHAHPYAADNHTHPGGSEAFPVGSVFLSVVSTNPATLLGYGTWAAFGAGRMLIGNDGGTFGTDEATGGADTHTHAAHSGVLAHTHAVTDPGHVHDEFRNGATTGGLDGWAAGDTSTNNPTLTGYDTGSKVTGLTVNSTGSGSEYTHDSPSHLPPYIVVHMWKRTA